MRLTGWEVHFTSGAVSVFLNGTWRTLCDSNYGLDEGQMVCRQLGFPGEAETSVGTRTLVNYGIGAETDGFAALLNCNGPSFYDCNYNTSADLDCLRTSAGVSCLGPAEVRLAGSSDSPTSGIVQIQRNRGWSVLCDKDWTLANAHTVCRSQGFDYAIGTPPPDTFTLSPQDTAGVTVSVTCTGYQDELTKCSTMQENFRAVCTPDQDTLATANCTSQPKQRIGAEIRLVDGLHPGEGGVEVSIFGEWSRLSCIPEETRETAQVLCRQLGFPYLIMRDQRFKRPSRTPLFNEINCYGNESSIADCPYELISESPCYFSSTLYEFYIRCSDVELPPIGSVLRLVQGKTQYEGRVEVLVGQQWGTICAAGDTWHLSAANVVCRQLGYEPAVAAPQLAYFGSNTDRSYMMRVVCNGTETDLSQCEFMGPEDTRCTREETASVICGNDFQQPEDYEIRLIGTPGINEGRIEIGYEGEWGGICRDGFTDTDAEVICHMLGYWTGIQWNGDYGSSEGPMVLSGVSCSGRESHVLDCGHRGPPAVCPSNDLAAVYCDGTKQQGHEFDVRIQGGPSIYEGRPEVFYNGSWGYLCFSSVAGYSDDVMCNQMGHTSGNHYLSNQGPETVLGVSPLVFNCSLSDEITLKRCRYVVNETLAVAGCGYGEIAKVTCGDPIIPVSQPPPKPGPSLIIKIICISVSLFVVMVMIISLLVRHFCCSSSSYAAGECDPSHTSVVTASYGPVSQNDPPINDPPPPYEETEKKVTTEL